MSKKIKEFRVIYEYVPDEKSHLLALEFLNKKFKQETWGREVKETPKVEINN